MRRLKQPTVTSLVEELLRQADTFMTQRQVEAALGLDHFHASAALCHLRKYKVVDRLESGGEVWWFALPPELDTRCWRRLERTPETKPRRPRKKLHLAERGGL